MRITTITVVTGWKGNGSGLSSYHPAIVDEHLPIAWWDVSNKNPLSSALFTIQAKFDDATLAALMANPKYANLFNIISVSVPDVS
jgi:hypothetical protein